MWNVALSDERQPSQPQILQSGHNSLNGRLDWSKNRERFNVHKSALHFSWDFQRTGASKKSRKLQQKRIWLWHFWSILVHSALLFLYTYLSVSNMHCRRTIHSLCYKINGFLKASCYFHPHARNWNDFSRSKNMFLI